MIEGFAFLVPFFLGLVVWRIQLIGKRRTEIAEEALLAFSQAADSINAIRSPIGWSNEQETVRSMFGHQKDQPINGEQFRITLIRFENHKKKFEELRRMQLLCKFHFGAIAARAFDDLHDAVHEVMAAAHVGASLPANDLELKERRELETKIFRGLREDAIQQRINDIQKIIELELMPYLKMDAAIFPVAFEGKSPIEFLKRKFGFARLF